MKETKVSIIIPVYNGEKYIEEAIESALNQTHKNIEIIVVNDGSTDNTEQIVKKYTKKIKYISKENGGVSSALNEGIKNSTGTYISWLSHDDVYYKDKIKKQLTFLSKQNNKELIVASNVELVNKELKTLEIHKLPKYLELYPLSYLAFDVKTGLNGCSLLIHKNVFKRNGLFDESLKVTQDYDMWSRFAEKEKFAILDEVLVKSRQHDEQGSKTIKVVKKEVDLLHTKLIRQINDAEFKKYFNNDIDKMLELVNLYRNAMIAEKTAIELLNKIYKNYYNEHSKKLNEFLAKNYLKNKNQNIQIKKSKKQKILIHSNIWIIGGIERVILSLFNILHKDYEIYFITTLDKNTKSYEIPSYIEVINIDSCLNEKLPFAILCLSKILDIDLFIGMQNLDINVLNTYKLLNEENIKTIASNHYSYYLPSELHWLKEVSMRKHDLYKYASAVVWTNETSAELYNIKHNNSYYIPNPNSFDISKNIKKNGKNILAVGRFTDGLKHLELTLEAFKKALDKDKQLTLTIVGKYDEKSQIYGNPDLRIKDYLKRFNIEKDKLIFIGETNEVEKYYKNADLFLLTSQSEGFGMVVTEAACFGVPTISFDILGINKLIKNEENGYLIKCYDTDQMAEKIIAYFSNDKLMTTIKTNTLKNAENYVTEKINNEWKKLINNILTNNFKTNIKNQLTSEELMDIFDNVLTNIDYEINRLDKLANKKEKQNFIIRICRHTKYLYKTYGLRKTVTRIISYPIKKWREK